MRGLGWNQKQVQKEKQVQKVKQVQKEKQKNRLMLKLLLLNDKDQLKENEESRDNG